MTTRPDLLPLTAIGGPAAQPPPFINVDDEAGKPRFRLEVAHQRRTFFGRETQMKKSQWSPLPPDEQASVDHGLILPSDASRRPVYDDPTPAAATAAWLAARPRSWKPGAWNAGRRYVGYENAFGAPPLATISDEALAHRINTLERGVLRARSEVDLYAHALLTRPTVHRGYVHENQTELEQELVVALHERDRRIHVRRRRDEAEARKFRRITGAQVVQESPKAQRFLPQPGSMSSSAPTLRMDPMDREYFETSKTLRKAASSNLPKL